MKKSLVLSLLFLGCLLQAQNGFLAGQKKFERVRGAFQDKNKIAEVTLKSHGLNVANLHILIVAYKQEGQLELYGKAKTGLKYKKLRSFPICALSGKLGPKRKYGDYQVPEGFYHIDRFNPTSSYYLSLGLNYPNASDKIKTGKGDPGGDIFIHGQCVTIGCMPMEDNISEIYLYAVHARNNGQMKIPVYVFPFKMTDQNLEKNCSRFSSRPELPPFWKNIKVGYDLFEKNQEELKFGVDKSGNYQF